MIRLPFRKNAAAPRPNDQCSRSSSSSPHTSHAHRRHSSAAASTSSLVWSVASMIRADSKAVRYLVNLSGRTVSKPPRLSKVAEIFPMLLQLLQRCHVQAHWYVTPSQSVVLS